MNVSHAVIYTIIECECPIQLISNDSSEIVGLFNKLVKRLLRNKFTFRTSNSLNSITINYTGNC